jgi:hypothetical protein
LAGIAHRALLAEAAHGGEHLVADAAAGRLLACAAAAAATPASRLRRSVRTRSSATPIQARPPTAPTVSTRPAT